MVGSAGAVTAVQSRKSLDHPDANTIDGVLAFDGVGLDKLPPFFDQYHLPYDECLDIIAEDAYEAGETLVKTDMGILDAKRPEFDELLTKIAKYACEYEIKSDLAYETALFGNRLLP